MNEVIEKENIKIEDMIFEVRGVNVILASDVAKLYNSETKKINQVVKRNIKRFPENFCFQLTHFEYYSLRSQIVTSSERNEIIHGGNRYLPYVFTEHGVMMLSGLLKSDIACEVNVLIINAFVAMKKYISNNLLEQKYMYRDGKKKLKPYAEHTKSGLFEIKECFNEKTGWKGTQVLITPKGRETFRLLCIDK